MYNQENFKEVTRQPISVKKPEEKDFEKFKENCNRILNNCVKPKILYRFDPKRLKKDAERFKKSKIYLDFIASCPPVEKDIDNSFEAILLRTRERIRKNESKKARTIGY